MTNFHVFGIFLEIDVPPACFSHSAEEL